MEDFFLEGVTWFSGGNGRVSVYVKSSTEYMGGGGRGEYNIDR